MIRDSNPKVTTPTVKHFKRNKSKEVMDQNSMIEKFGHKALPVDM